MKLTTLYSRRGDGKVQEWTIEVQDDKFRTISGLTDGEKVISEWTVCLPKNVGRTNETTASKQAMAEAKAKWKKKVEKGYAESQADVDSHGLFKPTLAHKYEDHKDKVFKNGNTVFSDPKYNGMRCVANADGLWTRNGKKIIACPHIVSALAPLFTKYPNLVLDGELYNHELRHKLNRIMELVRKSILSADDFAKSAELIEYHVYDGVNINSLGPKELFSKRKAAIKKAVTSLRNKSIQIVDSVQVFSAEELDAAYKKLLADDWEGQMVRIDGPYENKRTSKLLKRKEFQDAEYEIVDIEEGIGNWTGTAKTVILRHPDGRTFRSNIKGDFEYLTRVLSEKSSLIGKTATVKYFELTEYGIPQFPYVILIDRESAEG